MTRTPVSSSSLKSIGHDGDTLEVEFQSGALYHYHGISREHFDALMGAESIGKHFITAIRSGGFTFTKVDPDEETADETADENGQRE